MSIDDYRLVINGNNNTLNNSVKFGALTFFKKLSKRFGHNKYLKKQLKKPPGIMPGGVTQKMPPSVAASIFNR